MKNLNFFDKITRKLIVCKLVKELSKVAIVVPVFNSELFLERCLNSIELQTLTDVEAVIVDDCSHDGSKNILEKFSKKNANFRVIFNESNLGVAASRNIGVRAANSEFILFCDADDYLEFDACEKLYNCALERNSEFVYGNYYFCIHGIKHKDNSNTKNFLYKLPKKNELIAFASIYGCGCLIKRELFFRYNLFFDENLKRSEELPTTVLGAILAKNTTFIDDYIYNYVQNDDSASHAKNIDVGYFFKSFEIFMERFENFFNEDERRKYCKELEFRAINVLLYSIALCKSKNREKNSEVKKFINVFEKKFPEWYKNPYLGSLGRFKRIFLFLGRVKFVFGMKFIAWVREKFFSC